MESNMSWETRNASVLLERKCCQGLVEEAAHRARELEVALQVMGKQKGGHPSMSSVDLPGQGRRGRDDAGLHWRHRTQSEGHRSCQN